MIVKFLRNNNDDNNTTSNENNNDNNRSTLKGTVIIKTITIKYY